MLYLHRDFFHSIRFKVNKLGEYGGTPFFMPAALPVCQAIVQVPRRPAFAVRCCHPTFPYPVWTLLPARPSIYLPFPNHLTSSQKVVLAA